ncbi:glycoside hydrolase family 9 protein [Flammeovirga aprica]|uniref:Chitobiase n=1 Tax=Flammeovirga aprica JL-4 TaxID=694437 RepID=A0A7X9RWT4_9BACT|nr:glycoside hydrolase family 9 protein [Flammeovirga aprica]NME70059.1 chitobiase [Flammeovirga aprica JL-4]
MRNYQLIFGAFLSLLFFSNTIIGAEKSIFLINHLGYQQNEYKSAVLQTSSSSIPIEFFIKDTKGNVVFKGALKEGGQVDNWHTGKAYKADFTSFNEVGKFILNATIGEEKVQSYSFSIYENSIASDVLPLLVKAFKHERSDTVYEEKDSKMSFFGDRDDIVDASGGWYDASGEKGKYLSHLSFSNYMTPQQLPMNIWNMLESASKLEEVKMDNQKDIIKSLKEEAAFGADYLVRIQDAEGYFYATIFAGWTKDPNQREICAYSGQDGKRNTNYQAAFREGGGVAIADLARCASMKVEGKYSSEKYLEVAEKGYTHLKEHNTEYCDDGKENIIDDYTALLATIELYKATAKETYLADARQRATSLQNRMMSSAYGMFNWLRADEKGERPFFHGAEAGLPIIAMTHYLSIEKKASAKKKALAFINKSVNFELAITAQTTNPFGLSRQFVKATNEDKPRAAFFIPHQNETKYWWQGENARLASLATAMYKAIPYLSDKKVKQSAKQFASNQTNWILGLNPYNVCMLQGVGFNNPDYIEQGVSYNYDGGVCNGITAGFKDESDIAFRPMPYENDPAQRWRWSEQWLQHGGWMIPAVAYAAYIQTLQLN